MSKPVTPVIAFATESGNQPASQLDTNFNQLAAAINDFGTYSVYAADTGAVNAIAVYVTPTVPDVSAGVVKLNGCTVAFAICSASVTFAMALAESVTVKGMSVVPEAAGVPARTPAALNVIPAGRPVDDQE